MRDGALSRAVLVSVVFPLAVTASAVASQLLMLGEVPETVASHWGPTGADGFSPAWTVPVMTALLAGGLALLMAAIAVPAIARGERGFVLRFLGASAAGLSTFLAATLTGTLLMQRGLEDASEAPSVVPVMGAALVLGSLAGVAGWFLQPAHDAAHGAGTPVPPLARQAGERTVWFGRAEMGAVPLGLLIGATLLLLILAAVIAVTGDPAPAWILVGVAALLGLLIATLSVFRVRVDASGLTVRSAAGLVRMRVPARDIASVTTAHVSGLAQYGGVGIRAVPGATAVVLRSGPALEVVKTGGRRFVVTLDRPEEAAAVLAAVAEDARADQD